MVGRRGLAALMVGLCMLATGAARAEQLFPEHNNAYISIMGGAWESGLGGNSRRTAAAFGAEYRFGEHLWIIHPFVGLNATSRGTVFGYGGFLFDASVIDRLWFTPSLAVGGLGRGGGSDLGSVIQFRSAIELSYEFNNKARLGIRYEHISNAGIEHPNPGTENIWLVFSVPTSSLFGR
jgi:lipid A 3-O-deacylase